MKALEVLLIEDSPSDVFLTQEALKESRVNWRLSIASDGIEALAFLRRQEKYADAPQPDLVLLDLNMPRKDGREVLADMKSDPTLRRIPVIVLTSSKAEKDLIAAYDLHANCYIVKSADFEQFTKAVKTVDTFWGEIVSLPVK